MVRTKFMQRVFSAQESGEDIVLTQISNDIDSALENNGLETEEYNIDVLSPSQVEVHDKVNDEDTLIDVTDNEFSMKAKKSNNRTFSEITNEDDFRKYAHTIMKEAHGDDYNEEETNKIVDELIKDNPNADWGELIGRLTSGFGEKNFGISEIAACVMKSSDGGYYVVSIENNKDWSRIGSYEREGDKLIKKCKSTKEADKYIDDKGWKRCYSDNLRNFSEAAKKALSK